MPRTEIAPLPPGIAPWVAALGVSVVIALLLPFLTSNLDGKTIGDTDDAVRLLLVRDLLAGHGWFNVTIPRINPPQGLEMHWSRLLDGGIAALDLIFALVVSPAKAEFLTRAVWPMLWVFPAVASAASVARRLAGPMGGVIALILCICSFGLFVQFVPGRIDHHGPQIALMMVGLAALAHVGERREAPVLAGFAMALQFAVGLEAILLPAAGAAWLAARFVREPALNSDLQRFALCLGAGIIILYIAQTAPEHWLRPACDMLGANFACAITAGCAVIVVVTSLGDTATTSWHARLVGMAFAGATAAAVFIAMEPACLHGPFAMVDSAVKPIWLDRVQEMENIVHAAREDFVGTMGLLTLPILSFAGLAWALLAPARRHDPIWLLAALYLVVASMMGASAIRLASYAMWCAVPVLAAVIVAIASRGSRAPRLVWMAMAAIFLSPNVIMAATETVGSSLGLTAPSKSGDTKNCDTQDAYRDLDAAPPGLIFSEIDRGPFIVEFARHSAFTAPYHRIDKSILTALTTLAGSSAAARDVISSTAAGYVLVCPEERDLKPGEHPASFQRQLEAGRIPPWLTPVEIPGPFKLYRVAR
ncbi:hypothetical protein BH10PSE7_BH10PSE7_34580 [soil metagenome]